MERSWRQENVYPPDEYTNEVGGTSTGKQVDPFYLQEQENKWNFVEIEDFLELFYPRYFWLIGVL